MEMLSEVHREKQDKLLMVLSQGTSNKERDIKVAIKSSYFTVKFISVTHSSHVVQHLHAFPR